MNETEKEKDLKESRKNMEKHNKKMLEENSQETRSDLVEKISRVQKTNENYTRLKIPRRKWNEKWKNWKIK